MLNLLGLIPARGGSKRIPNKNLKNLGGKPLIAWTIETALVSRVFSNLIVSTDSEDIAIVSQSYGASVPWLRPKELSTDDSASIDTVLHTINWLRQKKIKVDGVMLLQPTSPFRTKESILKAVNLYKNCGCRPVVSFDELDLYPEWCFRRHGSGISPILDWKQTKKRSQEIKSVLRLNGLIYLASVEHLLNARGFVDKSTVPFICNDEVETLDIDTYDDWLIAEKHYESTKEKF